MMDQASTLRNMTQHIGELPDSGGRLTHVLSVSSGKGGVGKSNFVLNVGIAIRRRRKRVLIMDADMGLGNIDILLGIASRHNLSHVLSNQKTLQEILAVGPADIHFLPASSGVSWMANLTTDQQLDFLQKMDALNGLYDVLLVDTGAGISANVVYFNLAAQTRIVIVTPEPTSLTDAYALIKVMSQSHQQKNFEIVVNSVVSEKQGLEVYRNLTTVADRFLDVQLGYLGHIRQDEHLGQAVLQQKPVVELFPDAPISQDYVNIARRVAQMPPQAMGNELGLFWRRVLDSPGAS